MSKFNEDLYNHKSISDEDFQLMNGEMLALLSKQYHAFNPLDGLKRGHRIDWKIQKITKMVNIGGQKVEQSYEKPVLCVKDRDGNEVDLSKDNHFAKCQANGVFTMMTPFCPLRLWEPHVQEIMARNDGKLTAKDRQVISIQRNNTPEVKSFFDELIKVSGPRLAKCLAEWTTEDGAKIGTDPSKIEDHITDDAYNRLFAMVRNPENSEYQPSYKVKQWMFPYLRGNGGDAASFPGTDFDQLCESDQQAIKDVIASTNGTKTYGGVRLVLPDGSIGSVSKLNQGAICCAVVKINGLETKSGKGWSVVSNLETLILAPHGNGMPENGNLPLPSINTFDMLQNAMKKRNDDGAHDDESAENAEKSAASAKSKLMVKRRKKSHANE